MLKNSPCMYADTWSNLHLLADTAIVVDEKEQRHRLLKEKREEPKSRKRGGVPQRKSKGGSKREKVAPLPPEPRDPPEWVLQASGGAENPRLLYERTLTKSDVDSDQSRLLMPFKQLLKNDSLTPAEIQDVSKDKGVNAIIVNQSSQKWGLYFKICPMQKTSNYALNRGWNDVVRGNQLKENDKISLWTFHDGEEGLCFAIDIIRNEELPLPLMNN